MLHTFIEYNKFDTRVILSCQHIVQKENSIICELCFTKKIIKNKPSLFRRLKSQPTTTRTIWKKSLNSHLQQFADYISSITSKFHLCDVLT
jgi:DNA-directed RNA polymerase subunit RPC12/RpoP